jgi:hypothetical protein
MAEDRISGPEEAARSQVVRDEDNGDLVPLMGLRFSVG